MSPGVISLTRLEFVKALIEANTDFPDGRGDEVFPQLDFDFNKVFFEIGNTLSYPDEELDDPRHFSLMMRISLRQASQQEVVLPYTVSLEAIAYLYFQGKEDGLERFKIVRGTGYSMLYSAFREYIATFTGRSCHGVWFLPSPNFNKNVEMDAPQDVVIRDTRLKKLNKKKRAVKNAKVMDVEPIEPSNPPKKRRIARKVS
ncbi:hypothetical protein [Janthinobacterium lividum]